MNNYEKLENEAFEAGIDVSEYAFESPRIKGLYCDGMVGINRCIETSAEKACVLAEELGHHYTSSGNIIDLTSTENLKQERRARIWAYEKQIGLQGIIDSYEQGCSNTYEIADFLNVTEEFLLDAVSYYHQKFGACTTVGPYYIFFEPTLTVGCGCQ